MSTRRSPTLAEVIAALDTLPIRDQCLEDDEEHKGIHVYGYCDFGDPPTVTVNEAVHVVETLLHEVYHALRPAWSEDTVDRRSRSLFRTLTTDDIQRLHKRYRHRVKHVARRRIV